MTKREVVQDAKQLIRAYAPDLDTAEVQSMGDGDRQCKSVYLGSVLSLSPSGKYYMPWASSNVDACPRCKGSGNGKEHNSCSYCEGLGSREAYLDEIWHETLDAEANKIGDYVESGEGGGCDLFLCREVEEEVQS